VNKTNLYYYYFILRHDVWTNFNQFKHKSAWFIFSYWDRNFTLYKYTLPFHYHYFDSYYKCNISTINMLKA